MKSEMPITTAHLSSMGLFSPRLLLLSADLAPGTLAAGLMALGEPDIAPVEIAPLDPAVEPAPALAGLAASAACDEPSFAKRPAGQFSPPGHFCPSRNGPGPGISNARARQSADRGRVSRGESLSWAT